MISLAPNHDLRKRLERIGRSQNWLAEVVRSETGENFTQQSASKFLRTGRSIYSYIMIRAIEDEERAQGIGEISAKEPAAHYHAKLSAEDIKSALESMSRAELLGLFERIKEVLVRE